jgi:hypothetical protein
VIDGVFSVRFGRQSERPFAEFASFIRMTLTIPTICNQSRQTFDEGEKQATQGSKPNFQKKTY